MPKEGYIKLDTRKTNIYGRELGLRLYKNHKCAIIILGLYWFLIRIEL